MLRRSALTALLLTCALSTSGCIWIIGGIATLFGNMANVAGRDGRLARSCMWPEECRHDEQVKYPPEQVQFIEANGPRAVKLVVYDEANRGYALTRLRLGYDIPGVAAVVETPKGWIIVSGPDIDWTPPKK